VPMPHRCSHGADAAGRMRALRSMTSPRREHRRLVCHAATCIAARGADTGGRGGVRVGMLEHRGGVVRKLGRQGVSGGGLWGGGRGSRH
jgi:hypothetical protein